MASAVLHIAPEHNVSWYFREIRKFPRLSREQELELVRRWRDKRQAARRFATSQLRLGVKIALGYSGEGLPLGGLIGEGEANS